MFWVRLELSGGDPGDYEFPHICSPRNLCCAPARGVVRCRHRLRAIYIPWHRPRANCLLWHLLPLWPSRNQRNTRNTSKKKPLDEDFHVAHTRCRNNRGKDCDLRPLEQPFHLLSFILASTRSKPCSILSPLAFTKYTRAKVTWRHWLSLGFSFDFGFGFTLISTLTFTLTFTLLPPYFYPHFPPPIHPRHLNPHHLSHPQANSKHTPKQNKTKPLPHRPQKLIRCAIRAGGVNEKLGS